MDIFEYIDRVKANFDKQPEPKYNMKKYFMGGSVTTPKRGLVDGPGRLGFSEGKLVTQGKNKGKYYFKYGTEENYKTFYAKDLDEGKAWLKKQSTDFKWLKKNIDIKDLEKRVGELAKTDKYTQAEIQQILKDEGYVKPSRVGTPNYGSAKTKINKILTQLKIKTPTTGDKQSKVFEKLVKKYPKENTIQGIAELAQKELNLEGLPYAQVKNWAKANNIKLLTVDQKIFPEIKALDKLVKKNKSLFENIQRGGPGRGPVIINNANAINNLLFSEMKKLGFNLTPTQFNARLLKLDALYSGRLEPGTKYATDIYKKIKPIKNYEKSKFKKGLFATVKNSGYTGVLQEAQMLNLPQKDIDLLSDVLKGSRKLSKVKVAGDHTDSNALMRAVLSEKNWNKYKKDFMRINVISNTLNKVKSPFDRKISDAYRDVQRGFITKDQFNEIVLKTKKELFAKSKIPIGDPKFVDGKFEFNFLTERMGDIDNPRNAAIKTAMNNLVNQSNVKFKGIDQKLRFANTTTERFNILKNASVEALQKSKVMKGFAEMSGNVGQAAKKILKSKVGKYGVLPAGMYAALTTIASAEQPDVQEAAESFPTKTTAGVGLTAGTLGTKTGRDILGKTFKVLDKGVLRPLTAIEAPLLAFPQSAYYAGDLIGDVKRGEQTDVKGMDITLPTSLSYAAASKNLGLNLFADNAGKIKKALRAGMTPQGIARLSKGSVFATPIIETAIQTYNAKKRLEDAKKKSSVFEERIPTLLGDAPKSYYDEIMSELPEVDRMGASSGGIASGPPPEKGPQSQGLAYFMKNGKR